MARALSHLCDCIAKELVPPTIAISYAWLQGCKFKERNSWQMPVFACDPESSELAAEPVRRRGSQMSHTRAVAGSNFVTHPPATGASSAQPGGLRLDDVAQAFLDLLQDLLRAHDARLPQPPPVVEPMATQAEAGAPPPQCRGSTFAQRRELQRVCQPA